MEKLTKNNGDRWKQRVNHYTLWPYKYTTYTVFVGLIEEGTSSTNYAAKHILHVHVHCITWPVLQQLKVLVAANELKLKEQEFKSLTAK